MARSPVILLATALCATAFASGQSEQKVGGTSIHAPVSSQTPGSADLILHIAAKKTTIHVGEWPDIQATITNLGRRRVTLVQPGEGSDWCARTPTVGWSAIDVNDHKARHPAKPPLYPYGVCGNIRALELDAIFQLAPGQSKAVQTLIYDTFFWAHPGTYRVVFYYVNDPAMKWVDSTSYFPKSLAQRQLKRSTRCFLQSNEMVFTVKAALSFQQKPSPVRPSPETGGVRP